MDLFEESVIQEVKSIHPLLYKKTSTGAIQCWRIQVVIEDDRAKIITHFGQLEGKMQVSKETITEGKNIGRSNETTPIDQARIQAYSDWQGKLKKGYVENIESARAGEIHAIIEGGIFPMLAHKFSEQGHKIKYPAIAQPKFDGHRCIAQCDTKGTVTLWSRTRKPITGLPHIIRELEFKMLPGSFMDGELYNHEFRNNFDRLSHFIRQESSIYGNEIVQYHVYDYPHKSLTNYNRDMVLRTMKGNFNRGFIVIVESIIVNDEDELMTAFEHFLSEGYEGCMVRNCDGLYINKRSYDLQKVKQFDDSEFMVTGVKEGKGSMAGKAIFVCTTDKGDEFSAKMVGSMSDLAQYLKDPSLAIGRMLTVKYQGLTNKNNVPRFPVALRFKEEL